MNQIKIFSDKYEDSLEEKVNDFIKDKKVINVSYSSSELGYSTWYNCCVLYEEK